MTLSLISSASGKEEDDEIPEQALRTRLLVLQEQVASTKKALEKYGNNNDTTNIIVAPSKAGYLFKWQDRSLSWSGTKWALRYVQLDQGRLQYYDSHLEVAAAPRYSLSLRGCAVRDEGYKANPKYYSKKRHQGWRLSMTPMKKQEPSLDEPGAYFFIFSIYHRPDSTNYYKKKEDMNDDEDDYVPLLRFSTPSKAEHTQWIQILAESCAFCETHAFVQAESLRNEQEHARRMQQQSMAAAMPQAERGTLPALYFAPYESTSNVAGAGRSSPLVRRPSLSKMPRSSLFRSESKSKNAISQRDDGYPPSKPMHRTAAPSVLSNEATAVPNYRGLFNLAMILLVLSNFRLIVHTIRTHGFVLAELPDYSNYHISNWEQYPFLTGVLVLQGALVAAVVVESLLSKTQIPESVGMMLHHMIAASSLGLPVLIVWNFIQMPVVGGCLLLNAAITWMKLVSYALANQDYRLHHGTASMSLVDHLEGDDVDIQYPQNVTLSNMYYFWLAPTLTYQIAFPKTPRVRWWKIAGYLVRMVIVFSVFSFFIAQIMVPNLERLVQDLDDNPTGSTYSILAEYLLKLSITSTYLWLLVFYFYFHLYLNLFAELLRFGDRVFYKDWWNSTEVSAYWRLWNVPVHSWLLRHVYFPLVRLGVPRTLGMIAVFFVSAVIHEVLVSVPFHMIRPWSFFGMMVQIPLVVVTKKLVRKFPKTSVGNVIFWLSFCIVGQPMAILLYTIDYTYRDLHYAAPTLMADQDEGCRLMLAGSCLLYKRQ